MNMKTVGVSEPQRLSDSLSVLRSLFTSRSIAVQATAELCNRTMKLSHYEIKASPSSFIRTSRQCILVSFRIHMFRSFMRRWSKKQMLFQLAKPCIRIGTWTTSCKRNPFFNLFFVFSFGIIWQLPPSLSASSFRSNSMIVVRGSIDMCTWYMHHDHMFICRTRSRWTRWMKRICLRTCSCYFSDSKSICFWNGRRILCVKRT